MTLTPASPRRRIALSLVVVATVVTSFLALLAWKSHDEYEHALRLAEAQLGLRAWALAGNLERALDLTERDLGDLQPLLSAEPSAQAKSLRQRLLRSPHLTDLILYDRDGHLLAHGGFHPLPPALATAPDWSGQTGAGPTRGLVGGQMAMAQALLARSGAPVAILLAVLNRDLLRADMEQIAWLHQPQNVTGADAIAVVDPDGLILMGRVGPRDIGGQGVDKVEALGAAASASGFAGQGVRFHHGHSALGVVLQLRSHPFRLMLTTDQDSALAGWNQQWRVTLALAAGLVVIALAFLAFWIRAIRREQNATAHLSQLYQAIEQIPASFLMTDADARILYVNPAFTGVTGYSGPEVMGANPRLLQSGQTPEAQYQKLWASLTAGRSWRGEMLNRRKDGSTYWEDSVMAPLHDGRGHIVNYVAFKTDISAMKATETRLRDISQQFQATFEQAAIGIAHMDLSGRWLRVNTRLCQIVGYDHDALISRSYQELSQPEDAETAARMLADLLSGAQASYERDKQYIRQDGSLVWVRATVSVVRDDGGEAQYLLAMIQDISGSKAVETELAQMSDKLLRSNESLQQFAYVASHDLQEPLRMVISYLQLMERRCRAELSEEAREYMGFAVDGAQRMSRLIKDLLTYARVDSKGHAFATVAMDEVCAAALDNLAVALAENGAKVSVDPLPAVWGDEPQLVSLMQNLIGNALKYHAPDRPPEIHVGVERQDGSWRFSVADNGIGIAPQYHDRIFAIFQRLHGRGDFEGTGIGLAVAKKIVERHEGTIGVSSDGSQGSTFHFTLPVHT